MIRIRTALMHLWFLPFTILVHLAFVCWVILAIPFLWKDKQLKRDNIRLAYDELTKAFR